MPKRKRRMTKEKIAKCIKEGRGQGEGKNYKPWFRIQDVPSQGIVSRIRGWKTGRIHHLLSRLERSFFLVFDYSPIIKDIREQFPLPLEETIEIAEECGIRHPVCVGTKDPNVITTDFLLTLETGTDEEIALAVTVKPVSKLHDEQKQRRIIEKFEIERRFWQRRRTRWMILTEREVSVVLLRNLERVYHRLHIEDMHPLTNDDVNKIEAEMLPHIMEGRLPLNLITTGCDERLGLEAGTSLTVVFHLIAQRRWQVDLSKKIRSDERLVILNLKELAVPKRKRVA
ncbi:MAG TPA: TnsA endonuclease N-terminal domain-containing protein [Pyrinomonadaceae bacterium]|jgi:hypothetical protein